MKYALEIVRMFNGLEREQLYFFMKKKFPERNPNVDIDRLLRMKRLFEAFEDSSCNSYNSYNSAVHIPYSEFNSDIQEAVQILQEFWSKNLVDFSKGDYPVLLRFTKLMSESARDFCVCNDKDISDYCLYKDNTLVIVITDNRNLQCPLLRNYVLAVKDNCKHKFYKPESKQTEKEGETNEL
jgi:hypothetical protein